MKLGLPKMSLLVLTAGLLGASGASAKTLTFNQWLPASHFLQTDVMQPWADEVEKATEGRVQIQFTATSLGPPPRQFDLAKQGVADIAFGVQGYTPGRFPTSESVEFPFLGDSAESMSVAYWRTYNKYFAQAGEYAGIKLLSLHTHPPGELFTNTAPLRTLEDIEGLKLRVLNPSTAHMTEVLNGAAVSAPSSKAYELLSRGVIDGTFLTADAVPQFKLTDYIHHQMTVDGGFFNASFFLVMNERVWNGLSAEDQQAIEKLSGEAFAKRAGKAWDAARAEGQKILEQHDVTHTRVEGDMLETLKKKIGNVEQAWIESMRQKDVDGAAALEMIRREAANYSSR